MSKLSKSTVTMVLGGAASGKSDFAERFVIRQGDPRVYIATAQPFDDEMRAKIETHKAIRAAAGWRTIEEPLDLTGALGQTGNGPVLIDCATLWLSNMLLAEADIDGISAIFLNAVDRHPTPMTIVTNEVGQGIVPDHAMGRQFRAIQGRFNRTLAAKADLVVQVTAGLPQALKGTLP